MPLTETDIKAEKADPTKERWLNDGSGLYVRIVPSDRRTWVWRTKRNGRTSYVTLGTWPDLSVKQARAALAKRTGRSTPLNALTVKDALEEWYADQIEPRYRVTKSVRTYVTKAVAEFGSRRLQELTRAEIARFVRGYAKQSPVAANRCLSALKLALAWCVEIGYLELSPGSGLTRRIAGGNEASRSRVLSDAEIREMWRLDSPNANLLRALLLTGCRISELQQASTAHLRTGEKIEEMRPSVEGEWLLVPSENSKNGRAHHVYIVPETRVQFNGTAPLLFRRTTATNVQAWLRRVQINIDGDEMPREPWASIQPLDEETDEPLGPWTAHDLRRTFATRLGGLGVAPHVIEKLLNHSAEGVAAIYNRATLEGERIAATNLWAADLARIVA